LQIEIGRYVLPSCGRKSCNSGMVEDEEHFCVGYPGLKEARDPLLKLMEEAQSGFGMLQDDSSRKNSSA